MENDDDFTFCKVDLPVNQDAFEAQKLVPEIGSITLKDELSNTPDDNQSSNFLWKGEASKKQATVGSLAFNVIDTFARTSELPRQASSESAGNSVKLSQEQKTIARKSAPRAKVPFEKGYSQMDWLKLTRTHPDLAGLKGKSNKRLISMNEVKENGSTWTVLKGRVYNLSPYMRFHPGGVDILTKALGKDCTSLFNKYHAWVNADFLLEKCLVGILDESH